MAFAGGVCGSLLQSPGAKATTQDENPYTAMAQLGRVLVQIENNYVEPVDRAKMVNGAIKGMVEELDPHSSYLPPKEYSDFQEDTEGKFAGIGIEVDARNEMVTVIAPIEGSPAERAGLKSGDRIVAIDGEIIQVVALDKLVKKMRGLPGTHVKLTVKRPATRDLITFDLVREVVHVPSVASKLLTGNIAYVRIKQFQDHTHDELLRAAAKVRSGTNAPITGVILDLRNNPGGLVDEAAEVADEFLSSGVIYTTRHRGQVVDEVKARGGGAFSDVPVVMLVNQYSASASELVAGALQDQNRALALGTNTFGKGSVQSIIPLPNGAGLKMTTARYYTPSGHSIQADGIHPDVTLDPAKPDPNALPPLRERDLEGHLPAEGIQGVDVPAQDAGVAAFSGDAGAHVEADTRTMPSDPMQGEDYVLRAGYKLMREKLVGHGPKVK
jgi:carboxyl-terminal processing protease